MNADARAEAERRYRVIDGRAFSDSASVAVQRSAFVAGAEWQASRPFTEEDVEAAARSLAETQEGPGRWDMWDEDFREMSGLREDARAALAAVQARNTARHTKGRQRCVGAG